MDVHVIRCRARKHLRVAGPAQALVALRAIGGYIQKIAFLTPWDIMLQLINEVVGTRERSCRPHVGIKCHSRKIFGLQFAGITLDAEIPEPLPRKLGLKRLYTIAL